MRRTMLVLVLSALIGVLSASDALAHQHHHLRYWFRHSGAQCVHRYESRDWHANTGNGYYGGFQMGLWFQLTYAPNRFRVAGTANHWTRWHQMAVVRRVTQASGWSQWSTASLCGL